MHPVIILLSRKQLDVEQLTPHQKVIQLQELIKTTFPLINLENLTEDVEPKIRQIEAGIRALFDAHQAVGALGVEKAERDVATILQSLFHEVRQNEDHFALLLDLVIKNSGNTTPLFIANVFEKIDIPFEKVRKKYLKYGLKQKLCRLDAFPEISHSDTTSLRLRFQNIFGGGRFTLAMPDSLARALAYYIKLTGKEMAEKKRPLELSIGQSCDSRFTAPALVPLLERLKKVPNLQVLTMYDVGKQVEETVGIEKWEHLRVKEESDEGGFGDEHAELLSDIFRTNPQMQSARINLGAMTPEKKLQFKQTCRDIVQERIRE